MRLFARDIRGGIKEWSIAPLSNTDGFIIKSGKLNGNLLNSIIYTDSQLKADVEIASRIAKKRKEGYVSLDDLNFEDGNNIPLFLNTYLPKYNTDHNNNLKPMKCQKFKERIMNYPVAGQPKLNGLRAVLRWESWTEGEGLFAQIIEGAKLRTKEGLEYVMPHITNDLTKELFYKDDTELVYDGELYKHKMPLNQIKASCPMTNTRGTVSKSSLEPSVIQFHIFDLAIPDLNQSIRLQLLQDSNISDTLFTRIIPNVVIFNDQEAITFRDEMIKLGYEGCILRELHHEYAFGFRPAFIRKFKTHMDSEFLIIDIIPRPSDETLPIFILQNDINTETFECMPIGTYDVQRKYLLNKDNYIGKYATVRYRERTGTEKKLPFHGNIIDIRNTK